MDIRKDFDMTTLPQVSIYCDGGCFPTSPSTFGAWGAVIRYGETYKTVSGHLQGQRITSQRCEMWAAIEGLTALREPCRVTLYTDCQQLVDSAQGRRGRHGNRDLWDALDVLCHRHEVEFRWIRGHAGHFDQELADKLVKRELHWRTERTQP